MSTIKQQHFENDLSFEVRTMEWLISTRELLESPFQQDYYQIVWVTRGKGRYCIDMVPYPLTDQSLFFVPPGRVQQLKPVGELSGYIMSFDPNFLHLSTAGAVRPLYDNILAGFTRVSVLSLEEKEDHSRLTGVVKDLILEFEEHLLLRQEILSGLLNIFLIYLQRMSTAVKQEPLCSKKVHLFNNFCNKLEKDFATKRMVAEYASELSVTPNYLSTVVKWVTGYSASHHIQQRMVLEAKRMAMYSDANMKLIAYKLGFEDISHFSKFFKNAAGVNFSEFRNRNMQTFAAFM